MGREEEKNTVLSHMIEDQNENTERKAHTCTHTCSYTHTRENEMVTSSNTDTSENTQPANKPTLTQNTHRKNHSFLAGQKKLILLA